MTLQWQIQNVENIKRGLNTKYGFSQHYPEAGDPGS